MNMEIITEPLVLHIHGFAGLALDNDFSGMAIRLIGQMWQTVKSNKLGNKGQNIWVYEAGKKVFAGVVLNEIPGAEIGLQEKHVNLPRYAYFKHLGAYSLIKQAGQKMNEEISRRGLQTTWPYVEIYGHWNADETKLETELLMCLR
jgi:hypothetical protein